MLSRRNRVDPNKNWESFRLSETSERTSGNG
jgi:hypothetical protein